MCKFFSAISDGKGKTLFFRIEDITKIMSDGNKDNYVFNSHSSISKYFGIKAEDEHKWNFWEYDTTKKELIVDQLNTLDDKIKVKKIIEKYLNKKDILFLQNFYGNNNGSNNSGNYNSGYHNSGNYNSGYRNNGNHNSGNYNSGNYNSGHYNSGDYNNGNYNSSTTIGSFCSATNYLLFNKPCTKKEHDEIYFCPFCLMINEWIDKDKMTDEEKSNNPSYTTTGGYLKKLSYKEACKKAEVELTAWAKTLPNYDAKVFKEITGLEGK